MSQENKEETLRYIKINEPQTKKFITNSIKTAKYNIFSFLPLAILNQFTNYFNIFFLLTAIILSIPFLSPIDPGTAILPFLFILTISVIREAYEDLKKSKFDKIFNKSIAEQFNKNKETFEDVCWKDLSVGKIIKIQKNEVIPADVLILKSSSSNGFGYLQTSSLDGETGLKPREAMYKMQNVLLGEKDLTNLKGEISVDPPNENIYSINGSLNYENNLFYFSITNTLLRGGTLRNVDYIWGIILYTGKETKMMKNIKNSPNKLSSIETKLNSIIIYVIIITFIICAIFTALGFLFWDNNRQNPNDPSDRNAEYIYFNPNKESRAINELLKTFGSFFTIFNTLIPISVMITIEITKVFQVFILNQDGKMREKFGEKFKIFSMRLHEDLGDIKYIFTDKTGTLTKNEMEFKSCSIFTKLYSDKLEERQEKEEEELKNLSTEVKKSIYASSFDPNILKQSLISNEPIGVNDNGSTPFQSLREAVLEFFLNLSLNHSVLTETCNETGEKYYSGSSPDEVVLVQSAKEIGVEFIERSGDMTRVKILDKEHEFHVLHRFEYTSERKRSSILIKDESGNIKLYMKGADKIILDKVNSYSKSYIYSKTKEHLDNFCKDGLRTLVYSMKMIDKNDYIQWEMEYNRIQDIVLKDKSRKKELEDKIEEIEKKMFLMGATALEDKLQDDVKGVLNDFLEADINVWMLTGDQLDTAESIGYSCKLFNDDTEVYKLREGFKNEKVLEILKKFLVDMETTEENIINFKMENKKSKHIDNKNLIVNANALIRNELENAKNKNLQKTKTIGSILHNNLGKFNEEMENNTNNFNENMKLKIKNGQFSRNSHRKINSMNFDELGKFENQENHQNEKSSNLQVNSNRIENNEIKDNYSVLNSQKFGNFKKNKNEIESSSSNNNFSNNNISKINQKRKTVAIDIKHLNSQEVKFVGGNLDKKTNKITLNFVKNSNSSMYRPNTPGYSKSNQFISYSNNNPFIKNNLVNAKGTINNENEALGQTIENQSNYEPCDTSILKYMVDIDFFEEKNNNKDYTIIKRLIGENIQTGKMDKEGIMQILPIDNQDEEQIKYIENPIANEIDDQADEYEKFKTYNLDEVLNEYKEKVNKLESIKIVNPFDFVIPQEKKDFSLMNIGIIIEGNAIMQCLNPEIYPVFWEVISKSRSVICCRCSPNFKSNVVEFVKKMSGELTLAIGDGGNDVNMIKAANIGVGIFGKEGHQAAFNSDYAISQFKYLERMLFVHGRYSLLRNSYFINFFFFKNLIFTFPQFWFSIFSGFSGALLWDDWYYLGYNSYISTVPAACKMLFDEDIDISFEKYKERNLLELLIPDIYRQTRETKPFNIAKFFFVFLSGFVHSIAVYFIPFFVYRNNMTDNYGRGVTLWDHSIASYMSVLCIQYVIVFDDTFLVNIQVIMINAFQFLVIILFFIIYNGFDGLQVGGILYDIINNPQIWLVIVLTTFACVLPDIIIRRWEVLFSKDIINNLRHNTYQQDFEKKNYIKKMEEVGRFTRFITKFRKIFTKTGEFEPENLTDKKFKAVVDGFRSSRKEKKTLQYKTENLQKENVKMLPSEERVGNYIIENNYDNLLMKNEANSISNTRFLRRESNANNGEINQSKMNINRINQEANNDYNKVSSSPTNENNNIKYVHPLDEDVSLKTNQRKSTNKKFDQNQSYENIEKYTENENSYKNKNANNKFDYEIDHFKKEENNLMSNDDIVERENNKFDFKMNKFNENHEIENKKQDDIDIIVRENNKFDFKIKKFNNEEEKNIKIEEVLNIENLINEDNELLSAGKLIIETEDKDYSQKKLLAEEKQNETSKLNLSKIAYNFTIIKTDDDQKDFGVSLRDNLSIENNDNEKEENKNFSNKRDSQNMNIDNKSEFTFKQNKNQNQIKNSLNTNKFVNEEDNMNKSEVDDDSSEDKKRDPLIHDYPLEITNSIEDLI